jgi:hypothetical protein
MTVAELIARLESLPSDALVLGLRLGEESLLNPDNIQLVMGTPALTIEQVVPDRSHKGEWLAPEEDHEDYEALGIAPPAVQSAYILHAAYRRET